MVRTQIYLTEDERETLRSISKETGKTQSQLIRSAIERFIGDLEPKDRLSLLRQARGIWRDRTDLPYRKQVSKG